MIFAPGIKDVGIKLSLSMVALLDQGVNPLLSHFPLRMPLQKISVELQGLLDSAGLVAEALEIPAHGEEIASAGVCRRGLAPAFVLAFPLPLPLPP